eukprot:gnl/TRDRNA2_/TRDRNA2_180621_c0_seq1.p1 gnl/TRDRNA2_/TRDRNA2_180621_c0~~gnl/TRDRNA2_/TRDRNA2_180621_c0_seq1.p1  ORF type:complete len:167 (+),score=16.00 gnl/TRDRNA2_/TRDRNA2_180621_c0_seq1:104-604(+)
MSAPVQITQGIISAQTRVAFMKAMSHFGEVVHCRKPPWSGIPGQDYVTVRFSTQDAADRATAALKNGEVYVDGILVGVGPLPKADDGGTDKKDKDRRGRKSSKSPEMPVNIWKQRGDARSPSPRTMARQGMLRSRKEQERKRKSSSGSSSDSGPRRRKRSRSRRRR